MHLFSNIAIELFIKGGHIMWPLLVCFLLALVVIAERAIFWFTVGKHAKDPALPALFDAISEGDFTTAEQLSAKPANPFLRTLRKGILHAHHSFLGAMQLEASDAIEHASRRQWILATLITLAPLLGLLGTVTGIMGSFNVVGDDDLVAVKVKGGIAEALIATACGLVVAILCLLPHNYFNRRLSFFRSHLERTINHVELLVESARQHGHNLEEFARGRAAQTIAKDDPLRQPTQPPCP